MTDHTEASIIRTEIEVPISAPASAVWDAMFDDIQTWWHPDFHMAHPDSRMHFEPKLDGRLYEIADDGAGLTWYRVIAIEPGRSVTLAGTFAPPFAGPATATMHIALEESGDRTLLALTEAIFGKVSEEMRSSLHEGWNQLFRDGLKAHVERSLL